MKNGMSPEGRKDQIQVWIVACALIFIFTVLLMHGRALEKRNGSHQVTNHRPPFSETVPTSLK